MRALSDANRSPMNKLNIGFLKTIDLPKGGYLLIDDEVRDIPRSRVFDPLKHCFNPLKDIDYKRARELAELFYTISPQGDNTLTLRNGKRTLLKALLKADRLDGVKAAKGDEEVKALIDDILISPVLRRVLCNPTNFSFNPKSAIVARISRKELGDFDALVLGLLLMSQAQGQVIVPDLGFYGRDFHSRLIREERLIAGVNYLDELTGGLRKSVLLIGDKEPSGAIVDDAEELAKYERLGKGTNAFLDFVSNAVS
jgi:hypothetical protein